MYISYYSLWSITLFAFFSVLGSVPTGTTVIFGVTLSFDLNSSLIVSPVLSKLTLPSASTVTRITSRFMLSSCAILILYSLETRPPFRVFLQPGSGTYLRRVP